MNKYQFVLIEAKESLVGFCLMKVCAEQNRKVTLLKIALLVFVSVYVVEGRLPSSRYVAVIVCF